MNVMQCLTLAKCQSRAIQGSPANPRHCGFFVVFRPVASKIFLTNPAVSGGMSGGTFITDSRSRSFAALPVVGEGEFKRREQFPFLELDMGPEQAGEICLGACIACFYAPDERV